MRRLVIGYNFNVKKKLRQFNFFLFRWGQSFKYRNSITNAMWCPVSTRALKSHKCLCFSLIRMRADDLVHWEDGLGWRWKAPEAPRAQPSIQCTENKRDSWINLISLPPLCPAFQKSLKHLCLAASVPKCSSDEQTGYMHMNMGTGWNSSPPNLDKPFILRKLSIQLWFNFAECVQKRSWAPFRLCSRADFLRPLLWGTLRGCVFSVFLWSFISNCCRSQSYCSGCSPSIAPLGQLVLAWVAPVTSGGRQWLFKTV